MTFRIFDKKFVLITAVLVGISGCLGTPRAEKAELFTYIPNSNLEVAIQRYGYLTSVNQCLQYRYKGQVKTPIFPDGISSWNKELNTVTVGENTIKLDELFTFGGAGTVSQSELVSLADSKCLLDDKIKISSVSSQPEDIVTNPKYRYSDFSIPNIGSKENTGLFTYKADYSDNTNKLNQKGRISNIGKPNCLYFTNGSQIATPVFPTGTLWDKKAQILILPNSNVEIGLNDEVTVQTTGALPSKFVDFSTVGDTSCLEALSIPVS